MINYYAALGLDIFTGDPGIIRTAYRDRIKYYHPDSNNVDPSTAHRKTTLINEAYSILGNPSKKQDYDSRTEC